MQCCHNGETCKCKAMLVILFFTFPSKLNSERDRLCSLFETPGPIMKEILWCGPKNNPEPSCDLPWKEQQSLRSDKLKELYDGYKTCLKVYSNQG